MEIVEQHYIPIPVAKKIMEMFKDVVESNPIMARVYEYLSRFSKCDSEKAEEAYRELLRTGFTEFAASVLINILPASVEEAKAILGDIDGGYSDDKIEKAVEILGKYCLGAEQG